MRGAPECQVLFELFASSRGKVLLGRIGNDAGRIVLLREINDAARPQVAQAVEVAAHFVHPKLLKVLGMVQSQGRTFVASEYIPGVSVFEIIAMARKRQRAMIAGAAVRIIIDALKLVAPARAVLNAAGRPAARLLHADCIWVTDYGETLLAEAGVSAQLVFSASNALDTGVDSESQDMLTAAVELFHLASGRLMTGDMVKMAKTHLSAPLAKTLEGVFSWDPTSGFTSAEGFANGLAAMPPVLVGTEATVTEELQRLLADVLEERGRKLALLSSVAGLKDPEGATVVYGPMPSSNDDADGAEEEPTLPFDLPRHARPLRDLKRVVAVEKPLEPEGPARRSKHPAAALAKPTAAAKPSSVFPGQRRTPTRATAPFSEPPAAKKARPSPVPRSAAQRRKATPVRTRPNLVHRFYADQALVERVLLGVLAILLVIATALALARPWRVRALVEHVKTLG
jgi:hypothetical protein